MAVEKGKPPTKEVKKASGKGKNTPVSPTEASRATPVKPGENSKPTRAKAKPTKPKAKPKGKGKAKRGPGKRPGDHNKIPAETYNILWKEYCEHQSIKRCADVAGIKYQTARKYVTGKARPEDGLMPIRARYLLATAEAQAHEEQTLAEWQSTQVKDLKRIVSLHIAEFAMIQKHATQRHERFDSKLQDDKLALPELEVSIDRLSQSLERVVHLTERLLGAADLTVEHKSHSRFAGWTDEEKMDYATRGILPEHAR